MDIARKQWLEAHQTTQALRAYPADLKDFGDLVGFWAYQSLVKEVELTPKPGLVDCRNTGAHRDMDVETFRASAKALAPWFCVFYRRGRVDWAEPADQFLPRLREEGMAAERDMFRATAGVNTHKGSIFALGLLCAAAGRVIARGGLLDRDALCEEVSAICAHLVEAELGQHKEASTVGELLFQRYGMTGARGEAASGFATVRLHGLPVFDAACSEGCKEAVAMSSTLLALMAHNADTNVVSRGGLEGLAFVQNEAQALIGAGGATHPDYLARMEAFDEACIERNLSPGGSADLLAVTWFLSRFQA